VDESAVTGPAREVVARLALLKASEVERSILEEPGLATDRENWVLGADTVVVLGSGDDERILGKPRDARDATRMLEALSGRSHTVYTGLALCRPGRAPETAVEATEVRLRRLSGDVIEAYVATEGPLDKAGAYGIQGEGARLVEWIDGCYYNVVGLPLSLTARLLGPLVAPGARLCDCASHPLQRGAPRCDR
jgi:septum formation protein